MVVVVVMDDCSWSRLVIIVVMDNCGGLRVVLTIVAITVVLSIATMVMCPVSWTLVGRYMCDNRLREVPGCITRTTSAFMSAAPGLLGGRPAGGPVAVASLAVIDMCHLHVPSLVDDLVLDQSLWRHRDGHLDDFPGSRTGTGTCTTRWIGGVGCGTGTGPSCECTWVPHADAPGQEL